MKSMVVNYKVFTDKISDKTILVLCDLHDYPGKRKTFLVDEILDCNPDIILIPGDIIKSQKYLDDSISKRRLMDFLKNISETSPVFLGLGNHDLYGATKETIEGYKSLEKANEGKVFPLSNESKVIDGIRITEFHPRHDAFSPAVQESGKGLLDFVGDYTKSGIYIPNDDRLFNILLCHNPKLFAQARSTGEHLKLELSNELFSALYNFTKEMEKYDLVASGHLHNGYMLLSKTIKNPEEYMDKGYWEMPMEKDINGNVSKIRPWVFKKTDMCRGTIFVGGTAERIIELCNGNYYLQKRSSDEPIQISEEEALNRIKILNMTPVVISGGVNKFFNLPIDHSEITQVRVLKR